MQLFEAIDCAKRMHNLIQREATGEAELFAERLHISRRTLFNIFEELRSLGADIKYDKLRHTYYYNNDFEINIRIRILSDEEVEKANGGFFLKKNSRVQIFALYPPNFAPVINQKTVHSLEKDYKENY